MVRRLQLTVNPLKWVSLVLALGLLGVGVAAAVWSLRPDSTAAAAPAAAATVTATVTSPMPCSAPNSKDGVQYQRDGKPQQATLEGCGHQKDAQLVVEVPAGSPGTVREQGMALASTGGLGDRLFVPMLVLAALAGGSYALVIAGNLRPGRRTVSPRAR